MPLQVVRSLMRAALLDKEAKIAQLAAQNKRLVRFDLACACLA
jgi:hypothetical protein